MKKKFTVVSSLLAVALALSAQPSQVRVASGEIYAEKQQSYTPSFKGDGKDAKVRNVILLIGDGMGQGAVNSAMYANGGSLTMTNLKTMGYVRTQSADDFITDSAASGTAYATGQKTNNGYLGMNTEKQSIANAPEKLAPLGFACGVVSTDMLTGATPAAFFAHQVSRSAAEAIWSDLAASSLDFVSAGTQDAFEQLSLKTQDAIKSRYKLAFSPEEVKGTSDRFVYLPKSVKYDERADYLPSTTLMAIDYLSTRGDKGFFLMVEGARIDKEEHANNFPAMVKETLDFDKAVEQAVRFAEKDGHTLVIISADHETGATTMTGGDPGAGYTKGVFASKGHSPMMVPLFAYGPHSGDFCGTQENSDVGAKILHLLAGDKVK